MAQGRLNLMDPPIEDLLDKVDSKFTLVALGALRARQVNAYYNSLGEGLGRVVPPQVASVSGKPLSIAFEEIAASKATYVRIDPDELAAQAEAELAEAALVEAALVEAEVAEAGLAEAEVAEAEVAEAGLAEAEVAETGLAETELTALEGGLSESSLEEAASPAEPAEDEGPAAG
jgi:DNA-directed RNA polymerase subunit omega